MTALAALWLPVLVSSVIVFVASSLVHMVLPWHKGDYPRLPAEDRVRDALRPLALPPGDYMVPRASSMKEMSSPAFAEKMQQGPVLILTVLPNGQRGMMKSLVLWFVYSVVVGLFAAHVAARALAPGASYPVVFHLVAVTAFMGYALALWQVAIWYGRGWRLTLTSTIDGAIYALLTAGTFGWLWPR